MSYKGKYKPSNTRKYKGDPTKVIYRSLGKENLWFTVTQMRMY